MAEDDIVQKIKIEAEGADDASAEFKKVGDAAEDAAKQIEKAGEAGGEGFEKAGKAAEDAAEGFEKAGESAGKLSSSLEGFSEAGESIKSFAEIAGQEAVDSLNALGLSAGELMGALEGIGGSSQGFEELTSSIQTLGSTAEEAFAGAQAAASTFGATATDLGVVQGIIAEISDQAQASGVSFGDMAAKFDAARTSLIELATEASEGITKVGEAVGGAKTSVEDFAASIVSLQSADASGSLQGLSGSAQAAGKSTEEASKALDNMNTAATVLSGGIDILNAKNILHQRAVLDGRVAAGQMAGGLAQVSGAAAQTATHVAQLSSLTAQAGAIFAQVGVAGAQAGAGVAQVGAGLAQTTAAATQSVGAFSRLSAAVVDFVRNIDLSRNSLRTFSSIFRAVGVPFPGFISVLTRVGNMLGPQGVIAIGAAITGAALIKLASNALEAQKSIERMAEGSGRSFAQMEAGQSAFEKLGVSAKKFQGVYEAVAEKILTKGPELAKAMAESADKVAESIDRIAKARLDLSEAQARVSGGEEAEKQQRAVNEQERAVLRLNAAYREMGKAIREGNAEAINSLQRVTAKVEQMAAGVKGVRFDKGTEMVTILAAVDQALGKAVATTGTWEPALAGIIASADRLTAIEIGKNFRLDEAAIDSIRKGGDVVAKTVEELKKADEVKIRPDLAGVILLQSAFKDLKKSWEDFTKTLGESNFAGLLAGSLAVVLKLFGYIIKALDYVIGAVDKWITMLRTIVAIAATAIGQRMFGLTPEEAGKMAAAIAGVTDATKKLGPAFGEAGDAAENLKNKVGDLSKSGGGVGLEAGQLRQMWHDGVISLNEYKRRLDELYQTKKPTYEDLHAQWTDGAISLATYRQKLDELKQTTPPTYEDLRRQWSDNAITVREYKKELDGLGRSITPKIISVGNPWKDASKGADEFKDKVGDTQEQIKKIEAPPIDWGNVVKIANEAAGHVGASFKSIFDDLVKSAQAAAEKMKESLKTAIEPPKLPEAPLVPLPDDLFKPISDSGDELERNLKDTWSDIGQGAEGAAQAIETSFSDPKVPDIAKQFDWGSLIDGAKESVQSIIEAFKDIKLEKIEGLDFENIVEAAEDAARDIERAFSDIRLPSDLLTLDFSTVTATAQAAAQQIAQTIQTALSGIDLTGLATSIQGVFDSIIAAAEASFVALVAAAQTAAQGINVAIASVDFSGLLSQIDSVIAAFQRMEAAANSAAAAAASAAASGAGGYALGGLFRGRPGRDTNLAWLTDYEFIMRPEAVQKYGVQFMQMINALAFPSNGFRSGGLNRVLHTISGISAFREGGLVMPRIALPAFAAGGINDGAAGRAAPGSRNMRPLSLTIGGETFRNLLAPEDTAKSLVRASVGRQASATGVRPRWNK